MDIVNNQVQFNHNYHIYSVLTPEAYFMTDLNLMNASKIFSKECQDQACRTGSLGQQKKLHRTNSKLKQIGYKSGKSVQLLEKPKS